MWLRRAVSKQAAKPSVLLANSYRMMAMRQSASMAGYRAMCTPVLSQNMRMFSGNNEQQPEYIKEMTDIKDWTRALEGTDKPVLIQAGASWCNPCQVLKPMMVKAIKEREGAMEYLYVDIDKWKELAQMLQIQSVPVSFLVKDGSLVDQIVGVPDTQDKINAFLDKAFVEGPGKQDPVDPFDKFAVEVHEEGEGPNVPKGAKVTVHYTGYFLDGTVFDSSVSRNEPFVFKVGQGQVIRGWDEGLQQLKKGSKAIIKCPPDYAYGSQGAGPIKPNSSLVFKVEVLDFQA